MRWLKNLFNTHRDFTGDLIETADEFLGLVASNQVAAAEFAQFQKRISTISATDQAALAKEAQKSADSLSGYGISVKPAAILEAIS